MPTRDHILATKAPLNRLDVPEWGPDPVYIRALTAKDQLTLSEGADEKEIPFRVLVACLCDEQGTPIFQAGDEESLKDLPFPVVFRVFGEAAKVNGLSTKELEEAMAVFAGAQDGSSSTE